MQYGRSRVEITLTPLKMSYEMHPCTIYLKKKTTIDLLSRTLFYNYL